MIVKLPQRNDTVVLDYVDERMYEAIALALPQLNLRNAHDGDSLELPTLIEDVSWKTYESLLDVMCDTRFGHTYDRGTLEILMSPRMDHDWVKRVLGRMVETISATLKMPIKSVASTDVKRKVVRRGLQPDESYYIANEPAVRFKMTHDPAVDPPPDLAIEVDVTSKSIDRMSVYAALRVPEIWRHDGNEVHFYALQRGKYREIESSLSFPFLKPVDLNRFLDQLTTVDEMTLMDSFAKWVRRQSKRHSKS